MLEDIRGQVMHIVNITNVISLFPWEKINSKSYDIFIIAHRSSSKVRYSCHFLIKLEFSPQILEKSSNIKFHDNPSSAAQLFHAHRGTDRRADMTKLRVSSPNIANPPIN
jgi:hypothetical protein